MRAVHTKGGVTMVLSLVSLVASALVGTACSSGPQYGGPRPPQGEPEKTPPQGSAENHEATTGEEDNRGP